MNHNPSSCAVCSSTDGTMLQGRIKLRQSRVVAWYAPSLSNTFLMYTLIPLSIGVILVSLLGALADIGVILSLGFLFIGLVSYMVFISTTQRAAVFLCAQCTQPSIWVGSKAGARLLSPDVRIEPAVQQYFAKILSSQQVGDAPNPNSAS